MWDDAFMDKTCGRASRGPEAQENKITAGLPVVKVAETAKKTEALNRAIRIDLRPVLIPIERRTTQILKNTQEISAEVFVDVKKSANSGALWKAAKTLAKTLTYFILAVTADNFEIKTIIANYSAQHSAHYVENNTAVLMLGVASLLLSTKALSLYSEFAGATKKLINGLRKSLSRSGNPQEKKAAGGTGDGTERTDVSIPRLVA